MGIINIIERIDKIEWEKRNKRTFWSISSLVVFQPLFPRLLLLQSRELSFCCKCRMLTKTFQLIRDIMVLEIASRESQLSKVSLLSGEVTWLTSSDISQLKLLTSHAKTSTRRLSAHTIQRQTQVSSSLVTVPQVVLLVPLHCASSTHWTSQEPDLLLMLVLEKIENSLVLLIASRKLLKRMVQTDSIEVSVFSRWYY